MRIKRYMVIATVLGTGRAIAYFVETYPDREDFYEKSMYPPSFLTINAVLNGVFVGVFVLIVLCGATLALSAVGKKLRKRRGTG